MHLYADTQHQTWKLFIGTDRIRFLSHIHQISILNSTLLPIKMMKKIYVCSILYIF